MHDRGENRKMLVFSVIPTPTAAALPGKHVGQAEHPNMRLQVPKPPCLRICRCAHFTGEETKALKFLKLQRSEHPNRSLSNTEKPQPLISESILFCRPLAAAGSTQHSAFLPVS